MKLYSGLDWRVTLLFYTALHYLQATASLLGKQIGGYHEEIKKNIKRGGTIPIKEDIIRNYQNLETYSRQARYDGFIHLDAFQRTHKANYEFALEDLEALKKYLRGRGLPIV